MIAPVHSIAWYAAVPRTFAALMLLLASGASAASFDIASGAAAERAKTRVGASRTFLTERASSFCGASRETHWRNCSWAYDFTSEKTDYANGNPLRFGDPDGRWSKEQEARLAWARSQCPGGVCSTPSQAQAIAQGHINRAEQQAMAALTREERLRAGFATTAAYREMARAELKEELHAAAFPVVRSAVYCAAMTPAGCALWAVGSGSMMVTESATGQSSSVDPFSKDFGTVRALKGTERVMHGVLGGLQVVAGAGTVLKLAGVTGPVLWGKPASTPSLESAIVPGKSSWEDYLPLARERVAATKAEYGDVDAFAAGSATPRAFPLKVLNPTFVPTLPAEVVTGFHGATAAELAAIVRSGNLLPRAGQVFLGRTMAPTLAHGADLSRGSSFSLELEVIIPGEAQAVGKWTPQVPDAIRVTTETALRIRPKRLFMRTGTRGNFQTETIEGEEAILQTLESGAQ